MWLANVEPVSAPSDVDVPSPQFTFTSRTTVPLGAVTPTVKNAGVWLWMLVGGVIEMPSCALRVTLTLPSALPTFAVTSAGLVVVSCTRASPLLSVFALVALSVPAVVENDTGTCDCRLPASSVTMARIVEVPPIEGSVAGDALIAIFVAAAPPIRMSTYAPGPPETVVVPPFPVAPDDDPDPDAAPEYALTLAVPDVDPAKNVTLALPPFVVVSVGLTLPSVVVNVTRVPSCTDVPPFSNSVAVTLACPPSATVVGFA